MMEKISRILDRPLYTYGEVDRILDIPSGTSRRWIDGYERSGRQYDPVIRETPFGSEARVTWGEFIETYYLTRLRTHQHPIPMPRIRKAIQRLRLETGMDYVFAHEEVLHADRQLLELVRWIQDEEGIEFLVEVLSTGQLVLIPESRERLERIEFAEGIAVRVPPRLDIDTILVSGEANFGRPTLVNTNITPNAVAELVQAGDAVDLISDLYEITPRLVNDAGLFTYGDNWRLLAA